jgi:CrcB protein
VTLLLVLAGGAAGATTRYVTDRALSGRVDAVLPWGTLAVNTAACLLLGLLAGAAPGGWPVPLLGVGFCGGLSTWSTFGYETVRLAGEHARGYALANVVLNLVAGGAALAAGLGLGVLVR